MAEGVRVETYIHIIEDGATEPRIRIDTEGIYLAPSSVRTRLELSLRGASQLRSEVIQVEETRYSRSETYNKVSGRRVITDGWQQEVVSTEDRTRLLDTARLEYATRLAALRSGLANPESTRCADNLMEVLELDNVDGQVFHVVQVRSASHAADGQPCEGAARTTTTYWVGSDTFRPWRIVLDSKPPGESGMSPGGSRQVSWLGQTVFSDYDVEFQIDPPAILPKHNE